MDNDDSIKNLLIIRISNESMELFDITIFNLTIQRLFKKSRTNFTIIFRHRNNDNIFYEKLTS